MRKDFYFVIVLAAVISILLLAGYFLELSPVLLGVVIWLLVCADVWFFWIYPRSKKPPVP